METHKLEIILHSAKDLHVDKHLGTMDPYANVWFSGGGMTSAVRKTTVAKNANSCPVWEFPMEFNVVFPIKDDYILFCEIQHERKLLDRKIGEVQVSFKDLLAGDASRKNVSYPVKIQSGEVKGFIVLSHKFAEPIGKVTSPLQTKKKESETSGDLKSGKKNDAVKKEKKEREGKSGGKTFSDLKSGKKKEREEKSGGKTSGDIKSGKKNGDGKKKMTGKKNGEMIKRIAKSMGKKVATEAIMLAAV
ncbi:hypothetical protein QVD17_28096 [Tagetes erecta]|uniref:C2 domain-containing protein n=1 Tax=Tagetes erecta TaxID=13708 RepID=A0AAD8KC78_TARER|nr:hypothetical protein QVD17_28096 [Tagetes erecta]